MLAHVPMSLTKICYDVNDQYGLFLKGVLVGRSPLFDLFKRLFVDEKLFTWDKCPDGLYRKLLYTSFPQRD